MKLKLCFFAFFLLFSTATVLAAPINGFDGFNWGADKDDIIQVRGEDFVNWGEFTVWGAKDGETVSRFSVKLVGYVFKPGCREGKEITSDPCYLWGGAYLLTTTSPEDIETLAQLLSNKYGESRASSDVVSKKNAKTGELLARVTTARYTWQQEDQSAVELFYKSHDRDYAEDNEDFKQGIFRIGVSYYSSDYMKNKAMERKQEKSF